MLVIDGKYSNEDGMSTGRMQQTGTRSILGRRCRASPISSEEIVQRIVGRLSGKVSLSLMARSEYAAKAKQGQSTLWRRSASDRWISF
jgi:hypothetical protein